MDAQTFEMLHDCAQRGVTPVHADPAVREAGLLLARITGHEVARALGIPPEVWDAFVEANLGSYRAFCVKYAEGVLVRPDLEPAVRRVLEMYLALESLE